MEKNGYIVIFEWMLDTGYKGADLLAFAIVWDGMMKDWKHSSITNFAARFNIEIPDYIWTAVLRMREKTEGK